MDRLQHLFVVRIWQEPSEAVPPGRWRGSVEHVPSGQRRYFASLGDLNQFMTNQLTDSRPDMKWHERGSYE